MNFDIKPYKQRGMTCAIACMLMVLEYYKIIPKATWKEERKYYRIYRSKYMDGVPLSALAWHFAKNGLETEIIHSEKNLFTNSKHTIEDSMFDKALEEYVYFLNIAKEKGTKVYSDKTINSNTIKEKLISGYMIILAGSINESLHAILISSLNEDKFIICDPMYKEKQEKTFKEIDEFMTTSIGKWYIAVKK